MKRKLLSGKFVLLFTLLLVLGLLGTFAFLLHRGKVSLKGPVADKFTFLKGRTPEGALAQYKNQSGTREWVKDPTIDFIDSCVSEYDPGRESVLKNREQYTTFIGGYVETFNEDGSVTLDNGIVIPLPTIPVFLEERMTKDDGTIDSYKISLSDSFFPDQLTAMLTVGDYLFPLYNEDQSSVMEVNLLCNVR